MGPKISSRMTASSQVTPVHDGGGNAAGPARRNSPPVSHLGRVDQAEDTVKMFLVDDLAVVLVLQGIGAELGGDLLLDGL